MKRRIMFLLAAAIVACLLAAGCEEPEDTDKHRERDSNLTTNY